LGFKGDPKIENVKYVEWNDNLIKLECHNNIYFLILANGKKLCCGCGNEIMGPINKSEYIKYLDSTNQMGKLKNSRKIK